MAPNLTVGYWDVRGRAESIRLVLRYMGVEFEDKRYQPNYEDWSKGEWFAVKNTLGFDFPNLPYLIDGNVRLTHTIAILRYLGRKYKLDGSTEAEKDRIAVFEQQVLDQADEFVQLMFWQKDTATAQQKEDFAKKLQVQLATMDKAIGSTWVSGTDQVSYVDFWFYEYMHSLSKSDLSQGLVGKYSNLKSFQTRIDSLPQIAAYLKELNSKN